MPSNPRRLKQTNERLKIEVSIVARMRRKRVFDCGLLDTVPHPRETLTQPKELIKKWAGS